MGQSVALEIPDDFRAAAELDQWITGTDRHRLLEAMFRERGYVPNLFRVMGRRPELLRSFNTHLSAMMGKGTVEIRLKEMLAVRVSALNQCEY